MASATADRIRTYCKERGVSVRALSTSAFDSPTQFGMVLKRLDAGSSVDVDVLERVALAMGWTLGRLRGEAPSALALRDVPGWQEAADEARAKYRVDAAALIELAGWQLQTPPERVTAAFIVSIARAWLDARTA